MTRKLFAGIAVPEVGAKILVETVAKLKRTADERQFNMQWVPKKNWHVTLWYFGPTTLERQAVIHDRLVRISDERRDKIELDVRGFGAFPEPTSARVFWAGVSRTRELMDLYNRGATSFELDKTEGTRPYEPHLTLGRFRSLQSATALIEPFARKSFFSFRVEKIILYESVLEGNYPKYIPLAEYELNSNLSDK